MQENMFLDPGNSATKVRGTTLFERINRLSVMRELVPSSKVVSLDLQDSANLSPFHRRSRHRHLSAKPISLADAPGQTPDRTSLPVNMSSESPMTEDPLVKINPPKEEAKEETLNIQNINENYDLGEQNYFANKLRKSIRHSHPIEKSELKVPTQSPDLDLDVTIQTRERKRSLVYSKQGIRELVVLSSRREMDSNKLNIQSFPAVIPSQIDSTTTNPSDNKSERCKRFCLKFRTNMMNKIKAIKNETIISFTKVLMAKDDLREIDLSTQKSQLVLLPTSYFQRKWDILILFCIFYEFILIPLKIAFHLEKYSVFITFCDILVFLFSSTDIFVNFKTAYINSRGVLELNPVRIHSRYKSNFLAFDLLSTLPLSLILQFYILSDPGSILVNETRESMDYIQLCLISKVFRFSRLKRILSRFDENTLYNPAIVRITKSIFGLLFLWHWIACFYWFIAVSEGFLSNSWTPDPFFLERSTASQYNYSLLWAVTVTVGVGVNIQPDSHVELIYSSFVIVIGVALYGILLGSTSSAFLSIDDQDADLRRQLDSLNNFMRKKKVSFDLQKRIEENLKYLWSSQQTLNVSNQWFLDGVHSLLKLELCINLNKEYLDRIPMFKNISFDCLVFLLNLLESRIFLPEEFVICEGSYSQNLYFIQTGILEVIDIRTSMRVRLYDGDFFGEQSLFVRKRKTADVKCLSYSELLIISKEALGEIIRKFPDFSLNLFNYLKNKDVDQIKKTTNTVRKYWYLVAHAYEIAKFLKREDPHIMFEELFNQKPKLVEVEAKEDIKKKVIEAFRKHSAS